MWQARPMAVESPSAAGLPAPIRAAARVGMAVALVVFAILATEGSAAGLLRRGPFTSDFFDAQAHAILDGHLDVDPDVAGIEGFVHDGRTQLYFGLVPALLRLPVAAVTHRFDGRLTQVSMLAALAVALWAAARLLWRARRWQRGDGSVGRWEPWIVGAWTAAVGLASPLLFLSSRPVVYHETELWGAATTLVALDVLLRWWERPTRAALVLVAVTATVACNTRASVGGGAVAAVALTGALALALRRVPLRTAFGVALAVVVPLLSYAAVNQARFDEPFSVPFHEQVLSGFDPARQATLAATDGTLFGLEFAPTALVTYGRPDGVALQRLFPWVTFRESTPIIGDATFDTVDRSASLPVVAPTFVVVGLVGLGALVRRGRRDPWLPAAGGAASGLASTLTIAFIANRYLSDATPALLLLAAPGTWVVADVLRASGRWRRRALVTGLVGLTLAGAGVSAALAVQSQRLFILPSAQARHDLVAFQYDLDHRLRGAEPPDVRRAQDPGPPAGRGQVVLLDDCRGLYWSDGQRWWPLELGDDDGLIVISGPIEAPRTVLLDAGSWRLVAHRDASGVALAYEHDDGTVRRGAAVARSVVEGTALSVVVDRVNHELTVRAGDQEVLVGWLVELTGTAQAGPGAQVRPAPTPLCDRLAARLGADG